MVYLTARDVINVHAVIIAETGGAHGVRDHGALAALEELPSQAAFGRELYPGLTLKAALYIRNIIGSHPFVDGNKRSAMACADTFLQMNGYRLSVEEGGIETFALSVIARRLTLEDIAAWIADNSEEI